MVGFKKVNFVVDDFIQHCLQALLKLCPYNVGVTKNVLELLSGSSEDNTESQILQGKYVDYWKVVQYCESSLGHWVPISGECQP